MFWRFFLLADILIISAIIKGHIDNVAVGARDGAYTNLYFAIIFILISAVVFIAVYHIICEIFRDARK